MTSSDHPPEKPSATLSACCGALAATPARLLRPRRADHALLARLLDADAGAPAGHGTVRVTALAQAEQHPPAAFIAEGARRPARLRLGMTTFLVEHSRARFLVDPSMCADVHRRVLRQLPAPLRVFVAPAKPVTGLAEVLDRAGAAPERIDFALPTHLHWDHVAGLLELPDSLPVHTSAAEHDWALSGPVAPHGVARGPLRGRRFARYELDGPPVWTFPRSLDLFGDGAVVLVDLAGHTPGSVGVLLALDGGRRVLLAGDAVWHGLQLRLQRGTAPFPGRLTDADHEGAFATAHRLFALPEGVDVIAAHDAEAARSLPAPGERTAGEGRSESGAGRRAAETTGR